MKKKLLLTAIINLLIIAPVFAVPALQLYLPDADYYEVNPWFPESGDTWITTSNPFELDVIGATSPSWVYSIENVKLHMSLLESEYLLYQNSVAPFLIIDDIDQSINFTKTLYAQDFSFGKPSGISPHGIYPTYYTSVNLPNLYAANAGEIVYDYNKDFDPLNPDISDSDTGDIQHYLINYDPQFSFIHFDLTGTAYNKRHTRVTGVFAPYSHDADVMTPEPSSFLLLAFSLLGMGIFKRKY